ncbi:tetraspanin-4 isoform X5 [Silurus meridionalis]|nr:tetraspanin-4 isoform X5 [Silurus meridionalis]
MELPCYERVKSWLQENLVALWIFALCTALTQVFTPALYGLCNNDVMMVLWFDTGLILGLVFSMTIFCQAVKVDTFYA